MDSLHERVAAKFAQHIGNGFDDMHRDDRHWLETRGMLNGTFRDAGKLTQYDITEAAAAIIPIILEEAAKVAEHLNGWGSDRGRGGHAMHIAAAIRALGQPK